jgi:2-amino-4-hydroxy-6-hydroxymethyldihydropteridine diphosphokinase
MQGVKRGRHRGRQWCHAVVALGGNVGNVPQTFVRALHLLDDGATQVTVVSRLYRSVPLLLPQARASCQGAGSTPPYFNAACRVRTLLGPKELLRRLQAIERRLGRQRGTVWGPRTLDLDLLTYGDRRMQTRRLTLPHAGIAFRAFVLAPMRDVQALWPWPQCNINVNDLLHAQNDRSMGLTHKQLSWIAI